MNDFDLNNNLYLVGVCDTDKKWHICIWGILFMNFIFDNDN